MENKIVRTCPSCNTPVTILDIACNPSLQPAGMDTCDGSETNLSYTFVHTTCGSSMVIRIDDLRELLPAIEGQNCDSSCDCVNRWIQDADLLMNCANTCKYSSYRRFMASIAQIKQVVEPGQLRPESTTNSEFEPHGDPR